MSKVTKFPQNSKKPPKSKTVNNSSSDGQYGRSKVKHRVVGIILLITTAYFAFLMVDQGVKYAQLMERRDKLEQEISQAEERQAELKREVELLQDPDYLEILARRKFGFIHEDQELLELPPEE